jgi:hypothetical protein
VSAGQFNSIGTRGSPISGTPLGSPPLEPGPSGPWAGWSPYTPPAAFTGTRGPYTDPHTDHVEPSFVSLGDGVKMEDGDATVTNEPKNLQSLFAQVRFVVW